MNAFEFASACSNLDFYDKMIPDKRPPDAVVCDEHHTVDTVEVVRCKDCKFRDGTPGQPNIDCYQMHDDDFCSYGERKE